LKGKKNRGAFDMFVFGNLIIAVAKILDILFTFYTWIIIAQAIISWVRPDPYNPIVRFLYAVTEPVLRPIRRYLPVHWGGFDFSPLIVILAVVFLQEFLIKSLIQLGYRM
jgi:YggT family protein